MRAVRFQAFAGTAAAAALAAVVTGVAWSNGFYGRGQQAGLALVCAWGLALALSLRLVPLGRISRAGWSVACCFALLALWALVSVAWSSDADAAVAEFERDALYAAVVFIGVVLATRANVRRFVDGLGVAIAAVAVIALLSRVFPGVFPDRGLNSLLSDSSMRLSFPLGYWNGLAIFVGLGIPLWLGAALRPSRPAVRALALAPMPVAAVDVFLASSRGGVAVALVGAALVVALVEDRWAALGVVAASALASFAAVALVDREQVFVNGPLGTDTFAAQGHKALAFVVVVTAALVAALLPLLGRVRRRPPRRVAWLLAGATVVAGAVVLAQVDLRAKWHSFTLPPGAVSYAHGSFTSAHLASGAGSGRWQFWGAAVDEWRAHPLVGAGAGSFPEWWARHASIVYYIRDAHSLFLQTLGELGVVGLLLLVVPLVLALRAGVRRLRSASPGDRASLAALVALLAAWCVGAGIDWMWQLPAVTLVGLFAAGALAGPSLRARERGEPRLRRPLLAVLVLLAVALAFVEGTALAARVRLQESRASAAKGDVNGALEAARDARSLEPWAAEPYLQIALVEEQARRLRAAEMSLRQAIARDPGGWQLRLVKARIFLGLGEVPAARRAVAEARRLYPLSPLFNSGG